MALWKVSIDGAARFAKGSADSGPEELLSPEVDLDAILAGGADALEAALAGAGDGPVPDGARLLAPIGTQEVWAAGVTYQRSRDARMEESQNPDHYERLFTAERPELFFKATAARTRGSGEPIGIRADSTWDVPEPELGVVANHLGQAVGYLVGDDVSSRSIEGENPLYLPQAKSYIGSCAIGPCIVPLSEAPPLEDMMITLLIGRQGETAFRGEVGVSSMYRSPDDLLSWLFRALEFPVGVMLLTGTGIVPSSDFTLEAGDEVSITIDGLGTLTNPVEVVGRGASG